MPEQDTKETQKAKIVLVAIPEEKNRYEVVKALATSLGISFEEAGQLLEAMPVELVPSIPIEAGEQFAEKIRVAGGEVEVLPLGKAATRFCDTHPHRRARARCKEPGCNKYICELCVKNAKGKLLCPECYTRYKRRRILITLGTVAGLFFTIYFYMTYAQDLKRWFRYLYVDTTRVALVFTSRTLNEDAGAYYLKMSQSTEPGTYHYGDAHTYPEIDGWFQREFVRQTGGEINILEVDLYGLYELPGEVPQRARGDTLTYQGLLANRAFHRYFKQLLKVNALDLSAYDYQIFVELTPNTGVEKDYMEQLGSFHDDVAFVKIPIAGVQSNDYYVMTLAYYIARLMGAASHLDDHGYPLFPQGYANPEQKPLYPQENAELTGCYIPFKPFEIRRITTLDQVYLGAQTAYEIGWISKGQRDGQYQNVSNQ